MNRTMQIFTSNLTNLLFIVRFLLMRRFLSCRAVVSGHSSYLIYLTTGLFWPIFRWSGFLRPCGWLILFQTFTSYISNHIFIDFSSFYSTRSCLKKAMFGKMHRNCWLLGKICKQAAIYKDFQQHMRWFMDVLTNVCIFWTKSNKSFGFKTFMIVTFWLWHMQ